MHSFPDPSDLSTTRALRALAKDHITANHAIETLIVDDLSGRIVERVLVDKRLEAKIKERVNLKLAKRGV